MGVRNYNCSSKFTRTIKEIKLLCRPVLRFHLLLISFCLFVFFSFVFPSIIFLSQFVRKITLNLRATRKQHVSINWQLFCVCHFFFVIIFMHFICKWIDRKIRLINNRKEFTLLEYRQFFIWHLSEHCCLT